MVGWWLSPGKTNIGAPMSNPIAVSPKRTRAHILAWTCYFGGCILLLLTVATILRKGPGKDPAFGMYWEAGHAASRGANPFAIYPLTFQSHVIVDGRQFAIPDVNLNPPCVLPLFQGMAHLSLPHFAMAWTVGSFLLLFGTVGLLLWHQRSLQKRQILYLLLAAPILDTLLSGQIYFLLFFLSAVACIFATRKQGWGAAVAIGLLVAIKPTTAFWPLFLFLAGQRRLALRSAAVTFAASIAPLFLYGPRVYREWLAAVANDPHWLLPSDIAIPAQFHRLGLPVLGLLVAVLIAAALGWLTWKRQPDITTASGIALCAAILCAPLAWHDYTLFVAPWFVARRWRPLPTIAAMLFMVPAFISPPILYLAAVWIMTAHFVIRLGLRNLPTEKAAVVVLIA